jgi:DNA topoisomerase-3
MVKEDLATMLENSKAMHETLGVASAEKCEGVWNGKEISFKREWSGYRFTDAECEKLLKGEDIEIEATSKKTGKSFTVKGHLEEQTYKKKKFVGFKGEIVKGANDMDDAERFEGTWNGKQVKPKREWGGHRFTDDEVAKLLAGETIEFQATSKAGKAYTAKGALAEQEYNGNKFVGFKADFGNTNANGKPAVPDEWCNHKFTDDEKALLEQGMSVECSDFVSKKGSTFSAKVHFGKNDKGYMGIIPEF